MNKPIPMVAVSLFGSFLSMFVGSVDSFVVILLALVIVDYLTGIAASAVEGKLSSQVGFRGIIRKLLIFVLVAASHLTFRTLTRSKQRIFYLVFQNNFLTNTTSDGNPFFTIAGRSVSRYT
ncbi:phage holin family protein [Geobacillus stearothermophilus]|nr:phage holin family protein [Geobacillus stearothermophilus]